MSRIIKATDLHNKTRDVLEWARIDGEEVVVEYFGKPVVVILRFDEYQSYLGYKEAQREARGERFERLRQFARQNAALSGLSEEEASTLIEEAREEVYQSGHETAVES
jgi:PHD/YefM family antitoxin component YafN of YafNO toxin-antitoxin module